MQNSLFIGSLTKLERATKFIDELETLLNDYNNDEPYLAKLDYANNPPSVVIEWKGIGYEAMAVLGDAVHNLRAALDLLASELARINGKGDRNVYFPFAATVADFPIAITKRNFDKAGPDAVALLYTFAPYRGGNELLRAVHDLDIEDKHTTLLETHKTNDFEYKATIDLANPLESTLDSFKTGPIQHHFSKDSPLPEKPVIETLREIQEEVSRVIKAFRDLILNRA